ncbi:hypothetical protein [Parafrankia elaeagni]|uniref:hypothetical protein n=1 Tax=Parafrankia elaeagni TaxID=222534 RepID=UPI000363D172|nr:hypothetical protein [Parafrankia elaeagni]
MFGTDPHAVAVRIQPKVPIGRSLFLLAYCTALGLPSGHVVYVATPTEVRRSYTLATGIEIVFHPLDLTAPLSGLCHQIDQIAAEMTKGPAGPR